VKSPEQVQTVAPTTREQPLIRLPMWKLSACLLAAPKLVLFIALGIAIAVGGDLWDDRLKAEFWAGIVLYSGTIAGLAFLWCFKPRPAFYWAPLVIAGGFLRMAVSLSAAVAISMAVQPEKIFFWSVFLIASLGILATETGVVRSAITKASRAPGLAGALRDSKETRAA
jgi:hypothetical protein